MYGHGLTSADVLTVGPKIVPACNSPQTLLENRKTNSGRDLDAKRSISEEKTLN